MILSNVNRIIFVMIKMSLILSVLILFAYDADGQVNNDIGLLALKKTIYEGEDVKFVMFLPEKSQKMISWELITNDQDEDIYKGVLDKHKTVKELSVSYKSKGIYGVFLVFKDSVNNPVTYEHTFVNVIKEDGNIEIFRAWMGPLYGSLLAIIIFYLNIILKNHFEDKKELKYFTNKFKLLIAGIESKVNCGEREFDVPIWLENPTFTEYSKILNIERYIECVIELSEIVKRWKNGTVEQEIVINELEKIKEQCHNI